MSLLYPELLLLLLPLALSWRRWGGPLRGVGGPRAAVALLLVLAAAVPVLPLGSPGRDVVVLVDRSASMPAAATAEAESLIGLAEAARGPGDRLGVVVFGAEPRVLGAPSERARSAGLPAASPDLASGSDLARGLETALATIPAGRAGRVLLLSDGLADGADAEAVARRAGARGVPIDVRPLARDWSAGVAVRALEAPAAVAPGAPVALVGWVEAARPTRARYTLSRGEQPIRSGELTLTAGSNRLIFRDLAPDAGLARWSLRVSAEGDPHAEDDRGVAATRVEAARGVLVLNEDGGRSPLVAALAAGGLEVVARSPEQAPLDRAALEAFRVVALENVEAGRLGEGLDALAAFVEDGGGLLMTGGRASFGVGGYHRSSLDPLLPVSLEQRLEQRDQGLALVIAMDRSGSMAEQVDGGRTKMDLANLGAAAAIRLLSPIDHVGVLAVDEAAHVVAPLGPARDPEALAGRVLRVRSEGGGIYTRTALIAAAKLLEGAPQKNRHITLFADAADSEEQEGVPELLRRLREAGVTVSVIALGSRFDSDARFLEQLAEQGGGTVAFTLRPAELPRLFAQDTLIASRASLLEEPTPTTTRAELAALGLSLEAGPLLGGLNRVWPRAGALVGIATAGEEPAPVLAWRQVGAGRTAAWTGQVGGRWSEGVPAWEPLGEVLVSATRWLGAQEAPAGWYATARREGAEAVITVEREPGAADAITPVARLRDPDGKTREITLRPDGPDRFSGRVRLRAEGLTLGVIGIGEQQALALPPLALAGSPELSPADVRAGERRLRRIAALSGGVVNGQVEQLFAGEAPRGAGRPLGGVLLALALLVALAEIALRRLWPASAWGRAPRPSAETTPRAEPERTRGDKLVHNIPNIKNQPPPSSSDVSSALADARERAGRSLGRGSPRAPKRDIG